jgi:hypothetical protein
MKKWLPVLAGVTAGVCFASATVLQDPKPAICIFFQAPLMYFFDDLARHIRPMGVAALFVVVPLWFIYWTFLGALAGFVPRLLFCLLGTFRCHDASQHESGKPNKREMVFCVVVGLIILAVILACLFRAYFPPKYSGLPVYSGP